MKNAEDGAEYCDGPQTYIQEISRLKAIIRSLLAALPDTRQLLLAREDAKAAIAEKS